jgi:hypothetical protein
MTRWTKWPVAAALVAATVAGLPAGASAIPPDPQAPQTSWQLRAQVRPRPGASLSGPRLLSEAIALLRKAACGRARDLLWDGEPHRSKVQLTLWRQSGAPDGTTADVQDVRCHVRFGRVSAFRLRARVIYPQAPGDTVSTGRMSLGGAVRLATEQANTVGGRVLQTGEEAWITIRLWTEEKTVRQMIRGLARRYGVDVGTALRVAGCESGFNPRAYSYPYAGVFQQSVSYWPGRARHYGHPGASPFDAYANIDVSLKMARAAGWGHWGCA